MATKEKKNAVSKKGQFDQLSVPEMLEQVKESIKAITKGATNENKTTAALPGFGKVKDIKTVTALIQAHSAVVGREKAYAASAKELLGHQDVIKVPTFKLEGHSAKLWVADIRERVIEVGNQEKLATYRKIQKELESVLSEEDKKKNVMSKISDMLSQEV